MKSETEVSTMKNRTVFFTSLILVAAVLTACSSVARAQTLQEDEGTPPRTISVSGSGRAFLTPDIAYISIGVHTENEDAAAAVASNNKQVQQVAGALESFDIDPKDIQTTNFSIFPRQDYDPDGKPVGITFIVDNSVYVTLRDIDQVGEVLDAAVKAGANSISGIQFDVSDKTKALSEARQAAVVDAQMQAEELAQAAGVELGDVQSISTFGSPVPLPQPKAAFQMEAAAAEVPISPGQLIVTVDVSMVYQIQ
jgi:uncharacterized protein YggE